MRSFQSPYRQLSRKDHFGGRAVSCSTHNSQHTDSSLDQDNESQLWRAGGAAAAAGEVVVGVVGSFPSAVAAEGPCNPAAGDGIGVVVGSRGVAAAAGVVVGSRGVAAAAGVGGRAGGWEGLGVGVAAAGMGGRAQHPGIDAASF